MGKNLISAVTACLALSAAGTAVAVEVFQWTDADGVVHFSQWAPADDVSDVTSRTVGGDVSLDNGIGISEAEDPEGYRAHREQMDALWAEMEARRKAERERQARQPESQVVYVVEQPFYSYPWYPRFDRPMPPNRPPHRPPPRPEPPIASVPFRRP